MNIKGRLFSLLPVSVRTELMRRLGRYSPGQAEFDFTPPKLLAGESVGPPDFVGIGARNSGTGWWMDLILLHPGVTHRSDLHRSLHFFDRFGSTRCTPSMVDQYRGWFPRRAGRMTGEWTSEYLEYPWVPEVLHRAAPDTRLLLILRDPVERMRSSIDYPLFKGLPLTGPRLADAVRPGFYHRLLGPWFEVFDPSQFLILQYEKCVADVDAQLTLTFDYLGLTPYHSSETEQPPSPESPRLRDRGNLDAEVKERLVDLYTPDVSELVGALPQLDVSVWPNFAHLNVVTGPTTSVGRRSH
jgi:sulfotransferase family protein